MPLLVRSLDVAPDPVRLGRAVSGERGAVLLWSADGSGPSYVACHPLERSSALDPEPSLSPSFELDALGRLPRWVGLLPYEACRARLERPGRGRPAEDREAPDIQHPLWLRYGAVGCITDRVIVAGDNPESVEALSDLLQRHVPARPARIAQASIEPESIHRDRIRRALELISAGELYQVNLARRLSFSVEGTPMDLLFRIGGRARPPFGVALRAEGLDVVSTSPELLLELSADRTLVTSPIKGTRPRARDESEDRRLSAELDADPKERAELVMVLDVERNDLGRIAETGSVRMLEPPAVKTHATVHHRAATLGARLRAGVSRAELLEAMLPSGSVTGAPKVRAMEVIAELEAQRRGLYTGGIGYISHSGEVRLAMAIRTLTVREGTGHWFVGGGIVEGSDPSREVDETRWKSLQLIEATEAER